MARNFKILTLCITSILLSGNISAQYFGTNKPSYKRFNYLNFNTPHFEIYHYFEGSLLLDKLANDCEKWYFYHQQLLSDTFKTRNPIFFYANHADFQQTSAISGSIDIGTSGVTEGFKRRVVLPVTFFHKETDHVLGHELVHAFHIIFLPDRCRRCTNERSAIQIPHL